MNGLNHAGVRQPTFSIQTDGKVFLCLPPVTKSKNLKVIKSPAGTLRLHDLMTFDPVGS
jgi:hypothetical protein